MTVRDYQSPGWERRRRALAAVRPRRCAIRARHGRPDCHHRNYDHPFTEEPDDVLVWLCRTDHDLVHHWHERLFPRDRKTKRRLGMVTDWYVRLVRYRSPERAALVVGLVAAGEWFGWRALAAAGIVFAHRVWWTMKRGKR